MGWGREGGGGKLFWNQLSVVCSRQASHAFQTQNSPFFIGRTHSKMALEESSALIGRSQSSRPMRGEQLGRSECSWCSSGGRRYFDRRRRSGAAKESERSDETGLGLGIRRKSGLLVQLAVRHSIQLLTLQASWTTRSDGHLMDTSLDDHDHAPIPEKMCNWIVFKLLMNIPPRPKFCTENNYISARP